MDEKSHVFITHILQNIGKVERFTQGLSLDDLSKDELKQYAIVRAIEIIGEAAKNLSEEIKKEHPEVEWKEIIGTRDKMIHQYFGIDLNIVWSIIKEDLPKLKEEVEKILKNEVQDSKR